VYDTSEALATIYWDDAQPVLREPQDERTKIPQPAISGARPHEPAVTPSGR